MTKHTPELWLYQFHKEPLGCGEYTGVYTFGPEDECEGGRVEVRDDYEDPCEARADAEALVRKIVTAYNTTYAAGINPDAVKDLVEATKAGIVYDKAINECANNPDKMATYCTVQGDRLDDLYDDWIAKTRAALAKAKEIEK